MRRQFWTVGIFLFAFMGTAIAQEKHNVTIKIRSNAESTHSGEDFYLTGSFNGWNPQEVLVGAVPDFGQSITVQVKDIPTGLFEYKFTRGDWTTLASTAKGNLEGPLNAMVTSDTTLYADIDGWRDDFPASTASPQVHVLDSAFYFPNLGLRRKIWIYLPEGYADNQKKYPVVYMHDGQDLFDEATSKGRIGPLEWSVDETIDRSPHKAIVVAIAHAGDIDQRQNEYFVRPNAQFPNPVGSDYLADIVSVLKPYVDLHYRTLSDKKNTAMVGSSVGGLLSFYAGLLYPDVFGTLGVLSPSIWLDEGNIAEAIGQISNRKSVAGQRYYFYGGGNENRAKPDGSFVRMNDDIASIISLLEQKAQPKIEISVNPEGRHGAWYWQKAFPDFYAWWSRKR